MTNNVLAHKIARSVLDELQSRVEPSVDDTSALASIAMIKRLLAYLALPDSESVENDSGPHQSLPDEMIAAVRWEADRLEAAERREDALIAPSAPGLDDSPHSVLTPEVIEPYLRARLPHGESARITRFSASLGGFSKETYILGVESAGPIDSLVIRRDIEDGPSESHAAGEYGIVKVMHAHGVPVAQPLWADDPAPFGGSVLVTTFTPGHPAFDMTGATLGPSGEAAALALARVLAAVHRVPLQETGVTAELIRAPVQHHVLMMIDSLEDQWQRRRLWPSDTLAAAFSWLRENIPANGRLASVVHGDASLRNLLIENDKASALLDWELWHIGDPAEDLAYCRPDVEQALPWQRFLEEYRAHGGGDFEPSTGEYYGLWGSLRNAVLSGCGIYGFAHAGKPEARMAFAGIYHHRRLVRDVARRLLQLH